ncbi:methyl-accepting chemotaxis protein [Psychromonas sp. KJ10-10]|uniref:methyl-accepting chemotaxis protein n=1 Tax=Psychromonas sp. KJ10-10 TaxID=3391823 RepID=UPI0039B51E2A
MKAIELTLESIDLKEHIIASEQLSEENTVALTSVYNVLRDRSNGVYLFDISGAAYRRDGTDTKKNYKGRSYYNALFKDGKTFFVGPPYNYGKEGKKVSLAIAIKVTPEIALMTTIHLDIFIKNMKDRKDLFVYTDNGTVIVSPYEEHLGQKIEDVRPDYEQFNPETPKLNYNVELNGKNVDITAFWGKMDINSWQYVSFTETKYITQDATDQLIYSLIAGLICFIIACLVLLFVINKLVLKPVGGAPQDIASVMEDMATGELRLNLAKAENSTGIYRSLVGFSTQLSKFVSSSLSISDSVSSASQQLNAVMNDTLKNMESEKGQVELISTAISELSSTSQEVSSKAVSAEDETNIGLDTIAKSKVTLEENIDLTNQINNSVTETAIIVDELKKFAIEIGSVTEVIDGISAQTNLLALNATN